MKVQWPKSEADHQYINETNSLSIGRLARLKLLKQEGWGTEGSLVWRPVRSLHFQVFSITLVGKHPRLENYSIKIASHLYITVFVYGFISSSDI